MQLQDKLSENIRNLTLYIKAGLLTRKQTVKNEVSFVSQFGNPGWAEKVLKDGVPLHTDPDWRTSGANTIEEYEKWATTVCGMACTSMALRHFKTEEHNPIALAKDAFTFNVYQDHSGHLSAMRYKEYVAWIATHNLAAYLYSRLTIKGIQYILSQDGLVIASVNPNVRGYETGPRKQKGGHLVLVTGYSIPEQTITIQNPSGFVSHKTHHNHTLAISDFHTYFAHRGIALYNQ